MNNHGELEQTSSHTSGKAIVSDVAAAGTSILHDLPGNATQSGHGNLTSSTLLGILPTFLPSFTARVWKQSYVPLV